MASIPANVKDGYPQHVRTQQARAEEILEATGFEGLVLHSGTPFTYHADDQDAPFRSTPHFAAWVPMTGPGHLLWLRPGAQPVLIRNSPEDYWYEQTPLGSPYWAEAYDVREVTSLEQAMAVLPAGKRLAFVGDAPAAAQARGFAADAINPRELLARLDWNRSLKTPYEVACLEEATRLGALAHEAARACFDEGGSEYDIHGAYLHAIEITGEEVPYSNIIAFDEKGAILHYVGKRKHKGGKSLLIDCGATHQGYASDITRTWTREGCDPLFRDLVKDFHQLQLGLCAEVRPGRPYADLHHLAHVRIADLLEQAGILKVGGEDAVSHGLSQPFFPHGLGHFLGLQVHDVAGHQSKPAGGKRPPPDQHPFLRTTREIEPTQVFTIEPGLYFIEMLLRSHRDGAHKDAFNWGLIDRLTPHGGMRIEDNILVTAEGHRNLTRERLP